MKSIGCSSPHRASAFPFKSNVVSLLVDVARGWWVATGDGAADDKRDEVREEEREEKSKSHG